MPTKRQEDRLHRQVQRKLGSKLGGMNSSNKAQLRKIEKADKSIDKPKVPISKLYMYMDKKWQLKGLACMHCNIMMNHQIVIDNHQYVCTVLNNKKSEV